MHWVSEEDLALQQTILQERILARLDGIATVANVTIERSKAANITFAYLSKVYSFVITKWSCGGLARFLDLFYADHRDPAFSDAMEVQRAIVQACTDIMAVLDRILRTHGTATLAYAVWYLDDYRDMGTTNAYKKYIARIACKCIVQVSFTAGGVIYDAIE